MSSRRIYAIFALLSAMVFVPQAVVPQAYAASPSETDSPLVREWCLQDARTEAVDEAYLKACRERRETRLKTLKEKFPKIVFTKHFDLGGSHYAYTEAQSDAQAERNFVPGSALCLLELGPDGEYVERTLLSDPNGVIRDPDVSFDGKTVVFAWKKSDRLDDYHLYDYDVATGRVRQLTFGLGYADYEPCILPNGDIVFNSTRCVQVVDCWWTEVSNLYRCDRDGRNLQRISYDQVHTNYPTLMEDGRVIYTRWDYNDRGQIYPQALFQMNMDGTAQTEFYGNNSWFPTTLMHARGIPGSDGKVVAVFSGHHNRQYGKLGIVDPSRGRQENQGTQLIAPIRETKADRIDAWGQWGDRFCHPYPISEREFLVSYNHEFVEKPAENRGHEHTTRTPYGIYWFDADGNRELLVSDPSISCNQPVPLASRPGPTLRLPLSGDDEYGNYTLQDVYHGPGLEGIERGTAKTLRVIALDFRTVGIGSNGNHGPAGGAMVSTPIAVSQGTWDVKIPLGDAPIYEDGSAAFRVPARTPVYFQVLDENGHCIQTMRSWTTLQPGETFSCIGCHEDKNATAQPNRPTMALRRGPQPLKPFYGEPRGFSFATEIQPILDRHCIECHDGSNKDVFSLQGDLVPDTHAKRHWPTSYLNLTNATRPEPDKPFAGRQTSLVNWINIQESPAMLPPYKAGAARSGLLAMFDPKLSGDGAANAGTHNDVVLSREELDKLALWIDLLIPAWGDYFEAHAWSPQDLAKYAYYESKHRDMAVLEDGLENPPQDNPYRNLALNPDAVDFRDGETPAAYPAASSNSVYRDMPEFAASNALDGRSPNIGHGKDFPSWGPDKDVDGLWWKVDFGKNVLTDQVAVTIRADFPHDTYWKACTIEGSNGFKMRIELHKTPDRQVFRFPPQRLTWLGLCEFEPAEPGWAALSEVEVLGVDDKPRDFIAPGTDFK